MLDVFTPRCRAISAAVSPSSSLLRLAITARASLTFRRLMPPFNSWRFTPRLRHSSPIIFSIVLPALLCLNCRSWRSSASLRILLTKLLPPNMRSSNSSFCPRRLMANTCDHSPWLRRSPPPVNSFT